MTTILIDLQACQNGSRLRGLGRYARNMAREMARIAPAGSIHLLLNSAFPNAILELRRAFATLVPEENMHVVGMLARAEDRDKAGRWRKSASELLREAYIDMLAPDVVFMPSLVEGYGDDAALSIHRFSAVPVVVAMHDLIPLAMPERYLKPVPDFERFYRGKIDELGRSDGLVAISEQSFKEAVELLAYDPGRAINASEGAEPEFAPLGLTDEQRNDLRQRLGLRDRFVFYTGGADPRKNLDRLIEAFAKLPPSTRSGLQLVLAGGMSSQETDHLSAKAEQVGLETDQLKLLGFVDDRRLVELYNLCTVFAFPSLHEGFGLPCLEAMQSGAATIGSNVSSLPEVIGNPEAQFDPHSVGDIAAKLDRVLTDEDFRKRLIEAGFAQARRFSWAGSARTALDFIEKRAKRAPVRIWPERQAHFDAVEARLVSAIRALPRKFDHPKTADFAEIAQAMAANRVALENRLRDLDLPATPNWRIEGPFDSSYSLALVNRELALALDRQAAEVSLYASEGPGDYPADQDYLKANPSVAALHKRSSEPANRAPDVLTRNMYPPRATAMSAPINGFAGYAWEESGFPFAYAEGFNEGTQFVAVTANHVKKVLMDSGVAVPISVSGNGVDHWTRIEADPAFRVEAAGYTFLHVSSCFPRKGADVLLRSFGAAFTDADDVLLIIKTFRNPHNTIEAQLAELRTGNPRFPRVQILFDDLSDAQLKALYQQCDTLVAPSRAEGFGLPLAEAMLSGLHVITTGWSGQMDFAGTDLVSLIDFTFAPAGTHEVGKPLSTWAEPDADHLSQLMLDAQRQSRRGSAEAAAAHLLPHWSWDSVARRTREAAASITRRDLLAEPRLGWVTTFRKRCGIATYSDHLLDVLGLPVVILANTPDEPVEGDPDNVVRCWREGKVDDFAELHRAIVAHELDTIVIQFNYAFYDFAELGRLIHRLRDEGRRVIVTAHATIDPAHAPHRRLADLVDAFKRCDRLLVHSIKDLNRLKAHGLVDNVALFPHGVLVSPPAAKVKDTASGPFRIASYGFFLPNKGLFELIEAARLLRAEGFSFQLDMINAAFPSDESRQLVEDARQLVRRHGLQGDVRLISDFLADQQSLDYLGQADLVVYPYQTTAESASGAVRYGLAAGKAVAVSPLPIFDDVEGAVFQLPGLAPADIARGITDIAARLRAKEPQAMDVLARAQNWRDANAYPVLGRRLAGILRAIHRDHLRSHAGTTMEDAARG